jgi:hypothetical protein
MPGPGRQRVCLCGNVRRDFNPQMNEFSPQLTGLCLNCRDKVVLTYDEQKPCSVLLSKL